MMVVFKIWMLLLAFADLMVIIQVVARIGLFIAGKTSKVDWTCYNKIMLSILAITFLPVTAAVFYLKQ